MTQIIGLEIHALQAFAVWSVLLVPGAAYDARPSLCLYYGKEAVLIEGEVSAP